jgi:hypothetical protein
MVGKGVCLMGVIASCFAAMAIGQTAPIFRPAQVYSVAGGNESSITAAYLNNDKKLDLLVAIRGSGLPGAVQVLLGNGDGTFRIGRSFRTLSDPNWVVAADVNDDGIADAIVATSKGVSVLLGTGSGTFRAAKQYTIASEGGVRSVAVADVNRDGKADLVVSFDCTLTTPHCREGAAAGVLLGNGDGTFGAVQAYPSGGTSPVSVAVADLNRDGILDLVVDIANTERNRGAFGVLLGKGDGTFQAAQTYDVGGVSGGSIIVADVNGDGIPDVIAANNCAQGGYCNVTNVAVSLGNGDGTFQAPKKYAPGGWMANQVLVADVNRDGVLDLVAANICESSTVCDGSEVGVLFGKGDGTFALSGIRYKPGSSYAASISIAAGDVNGDGVPDLFVLNGDGVGVLLSYFVTTTSVTASPNPSAVGEAVTLTATVSSDGPIAPTGTVVFKNGSRPIGSATLSNGTAILTRKNLPLGTLSMTATYTGDALSQRSVSPVVLQVVQGTAAP